MGSASETSKSRSLGDLISALRPGCACPWCGAELQACTATLVGTAVGRTEPSSECGAVSLGCPDCGAEVHDSVREGLAVDARGLSAAA